MPCNVVNLDEIAAVLFDHWSVILAAAFLYGSASAFAKAFFERLLKPRK